MVNEHPQIALVKRLNAEINVHRVLWITVQLRAVWAVAEVFRDEPEIVEQVVRQKLIVQPDDSPGYEFTEKGCAELGRWFSIVYPLREEPGFREIWTRVTGLDH